MTPQPEPTGRLGFSRVAPVRVLIAEDFALYRAIHFIDPRKHARLAGHRWWHMLQEPVFSLRRLNSRVIAPEGVWVIWSCDGRDEISQVRDLSFGGLFVETASPRAVGAITALDFLVQEGRISADAVVRHLNPGHGVGLQFMARSEEHTSE